MHGHLKPYPPPAAIVFHLSDEGPGSSAAESVVVVSVPASSSLAACSRASAWVAVGRRVGSVCQHSDMTAAITPGQLAARAGRAQQPQQAAPQQTTGRGKVCATRPGGGGGGVCAPGTREWSGLLRSCSTAIAAWIGCIPAYGHRRVAISHSTCIQYPTPPALSELTISRLKKTCTRIKMECCRTARARGGRAWVGGKRRRGGGW